MEAIGKTPRQFREKGQSEKIKSSPYSFSRFLSYSVTGLPQASSMLSFTFFFF